MDPSELMDNFLIELHNTLPAAMQSYRRHKYIRPSIHPWLADEDSSPKGLIRQKMFPPARTFQGINHMDHLTSNSLIPVSAQGLEKMATRFLDTTTTAEFDGLALSQTRSGMVQNK
ncbi:hypothetical protein N7517_009305 [Penicillium concentricum]|uniref:Uncharacterized protein n=1 Tax=Penicillium concentricum TaxID=293559 RepID=A0A9W9UXB8_9EURO|nr:uncharacterized protein N7517_009305 [Penicillium concentricum]KAJ5360114.1 hypothetical protein N7517_009305 [Penicillium concentricum]